MKQSHPDIFSDLRKKWMSRIINHRWDKRLLAHIAAQHNQPLFSEEEVEIFRQDISVFLSGADKCPDWSLPPDQPLCLYILQQISSILGDPDDQLFTHLIQGVPTGFHRDIPYIQFNSWKSAREDPGVISILVQEEIDNHWVDLFPGDETAAQSQFPTGISVGKLGVAYSDFRPPRLVVDLSVGGLNQQCFIPEKSSLPSAKDILRSYPMRNSSDDQLGFSIDIKAAHKRVAIRQSERGLVGFSWQNRLHFYRVCFRSYIFTLVDSHRWTFAPFVPSVSYRSTTSFSRNQIRYCRYQHVLSCYCFKQSSCLFLGANVSSHIR